MVVFFVVSSWKKSLRVKVGEVGKVFSRILDQNILVFAIVLCVVVAFLIACHYGLTLMSKNLHTKQPKNQCGENF